MLERGIINSATGLHDLDDGSLNLVATEVLNLLLHLKSFLILVRFRNHDGNLVSEEGRFVVDVDIQNVIGREAVCRRVLQQQLALDQWDQVLLEILRWNLRDLKDVLVRDLRIFIEKHQQEHLVA